MENLKKRLLPMVLLRNEVTEGNVSKEIDGTDLAAVIGIRTGSDVNPIRKEDIQSLYMTKDETFRYAVKNLREEEYDLQPIGEVVGTYDPTHTLVLTRRIGNFGSMEILNKDALSEAGERIGSFFIVPSSRHELLLVPEESGLKADDLQQNLREINQMISPADRQSNNIYKYSFATRKITMIGKEAVQKVVPDAQGTHIHTGRM